MGHKTDHKIDHKPDHKPDHKKSFREATRWRLIPRVQDFGFFQGVLVSRRRLATTAIATTVVGIVVIYLVSEWIRTSSSSSMLNVLIIGSMLTGIIVASYLVALLAGDLFFPGRWRERVLLGKKFEPTTWEEEEASVKEYNAHFFLIMVGALLALTWLSQALTGGFLFYYQDVGFSLVLMRSDDPEERLMGLEEMVNPLREEHWQDPALHEHIARLVRDDDPRVQMMAAYTAGRLGVMSASEALLDVFRGSDDAEVRGEVAMAIGRMKWDRGLAYLSSRLAAKGVTEVEQLGIVRGLALMQDDRGGQALARLLEGCEVQGGVRTLSEDVVLNAFYALRASRAGVGAEIGLRFLQGYCDATPLERCAAADALRFVAQKSDIAAVQDAYPKVAPDMVCPYAMWRLHEEKSIEIVEKEPLRAKLVRAVGNQKDYSTYEWIWAVGADEREDSRTRKVAEIYAREMFKAYTADQH